MKSAMGHMLAHPLSNWLKPNMRMSHPRLLCALLIHERPVEEGSRGGIGDVLLFFLIVGRNFSVQFLAFHHKPRLRKSAWVMTWWHHLKLRINAFIMRAL